MRLAAVLASLGLLGAAAVVATHSPASSSAPRTLGIAVHLGAERQAIGGFGSSERVWSDPHLADDPRIDVPVAAQKKILRLLYRTIGLTRVRDVLDQGVQKQAGGPYDFHGKLADDHVAYVEQAHRFGLQVFFPGPVYLEPWMQERDPGATVTWAMAMLRRWRELGAEPKYYAPLNEPRVDGDYSPDWMLDVVLQLGRRLKAEGFDTKLVIPDDENPADALRRAKTVLSNAEARRYVGAIAFHVYRWGSWNFPGDIVALRRLATSYGLPLWMTEYSSTGYTDWRSSMDWAEKMHFLLAEGGVDAIDYLWGFFGEKYGTDAMVSIHFAEGRYVSHTVTPVGWITAQYARFVRPGDVRVAARSASGDVLVTAYRGPRRIVVVTTNPEGSTVSVRIHVLGAKLVGKVAATRSSEREELRRLPVIQPKGSVFVASLPARSITTFVVRR